MRIEEGAAIRVSVSDFRRGPSRYPAAEVLSVSSYRAEPRSFSEAVGLVALAVGVVASWLVYVFGSSQVAFATACAGLAILCGWAAWHRAWLATLTILGVTVLLGTEARAELAAGSELLPRLRALDVALLAGAIGVGASVLIGARFRAPRASIAGVVWAVLAGWAIVMWAIGGATRDAALNADIRLAATAAASWLVFSTCCRRSAGSWSVPLALLIAGTAVKALLIYATGVWAIGPDDRLQASLVDSGSLARVILVGGDSLLIVAPALVTHMVATSRDAVERWIVVGSGMLAATALVLSGTRSGVAVAVALLLATAGFTLGPTRRRTILLAGLLVVALAGGAFATGLAQRFATRDAPATGLSFRQSEVQTVLALPARDLLLGQGLGGQFTGKDARGRPSTTGWSHVFPAWVVLKAGVVGVLGSIVLLAVAARRLVSVNRKRDAGRVAAARLGAILIVGLLVMSLTLGRLALPEGVVLMAFGCALLYTPGETTTVPSP
jgi:hypothetical protein